MIRQQKKERNPRRIYCIYNPIRNGQSPSFFAQYSRQYFGKSSGEHIVEMGILRNISGLPYYPVTVVVIVILGWYTSSQQSVGSGPISPHHRYATLDLGPTPFVDEKTGQVRLSFIFYRSL